MHVEQVIGEVTHRSLVVHLDRRGDRRGAFARHQDDGDPLGELGHLLVFRQGFLVHDSLRGLPFFFWQFQRNRNVGVRVGFYDVGMWLR